MSCAGAKGLVVKKGVWWCRCKCGTTNLAGDDTYLGVDTCLSKGPCVKLGKRKNPTAMLGICWRAGSSLYPGFSACNAATSTPLLRWERQRVPSLSS